MSVTMRGNLDGTASILVGPTEAVALDSVGNFTVKGGIKDLNIGVFDEQSLTTNGYQKFPGGFIIQWAQNTAGTFNWPIEFPTACLQATATFDSVANAATNTQNGISFTRTTYTLTRGADNNNLQHVIAVGY